MSKITIMRTDKALPADMDAARAESKTTAWRKNNPEKAAALKKAYRERQRQADAAYYARNSERVIARQLAHDKANVERVRENQARWRQVNSTAVREYMAKWRKDNPELCLTYHRNRRSRIVGNGGKASPGIADKLWKLQKGRCACCRVLLATTKVHVDHRTPLARGGTGDDSNLQLLCARCNLQKKARCPVEFMQSKGFLL